MGDTNSRHVCLDGLWSFRWFPCAREALPALPQLCAKTLSLTAQDDASDAASLGNAPGRGRPLSVSAELIFLNKTFASGQSYPSTG